jgi:transcriptional regulator with XRE-family HTH domain
MTLQQVFIVNLKKFRKKRGISQMALAELCETSGNYIGEIEMGRRIPSFEKIEKIASALHVACHQLFLQEIAGKNGKKREKQTKDFLEELPPDAKDEIISRLLSAVRGDVYASFDPKHY